MRVEMNERHGYAAESAVFCAVMQWLLLVVSSSSWHSYSDSRVRSEDRSRRMRHLPSDAWRSSRISPGRSPAVPNSAHRRISHRRLRRGPRLAPSDTHRGAAGAWPNSSGPLALMAFAVGSELTLDALRAERRTAILRIAAGVMAFLPGSCIRCAHRQSMVSADRTPTVPRCAGRCARP